MLQLFKHWNQWLGQRMFFVVLSALLIGFNIPLERTPLLPQLAIGLFAYMTFISALGTSFRDFLKVLAKPWVPLWMLFLIHFGAPIVAWVVGWVFYPNDYLMRLGFMISSSIPVAVTSIIWTSITGGNVAVALVVVTLDTLVVPVLLPAILLFIVGQVINIDYGQMVVQLLFMVTIPSVVGMTINDLTRGKLKGFTETVGGFTSKLAMFFVIFINAAIVASEITWNYAIIKLLLVVLLLVGLGYYLGYLGALAVKERHNGIVQAMIYNVGMRNISFGSLLALAYFPSAVAVPVTLAMIFQQPAAAIVAYALKAKFGQKKVRVK